MNISVTLPVVKNLPAKEKLDDFEATDMVGVMGIHPSVRQEGHANPRNQSNPKIYSELLLILESCLDAEDSCDTPFLIKDNIKIIL